MDAPDETFEPIDELLDCVWGQDTPFNANSPIIEYLRVPAGCVGLAMAMAVYYHKYPLHGKAMVSYTNNYDK